MNELDKTNNATFLLQYHFITVIKYRQKVFLSDEIISDLKSIICDIAKSFDVQIIEQNCGEDHIHILFKAKPTLDITKFINILKCHSSRRMRENYKDFLKDKLCIESTPKEVSDTKATIVVKPCLEWTKFKELKLPPLCYRLCYSFIEQLVKHLNPALTFTPGAQMRQGADRCEFIIQKQ
jgi:putative transposase